MSNVFRTAAEVQTVAVAECGFREGDAASVKQALALFHDWLGQLPLWENSLVELYL